MLHTPIRYINNGEPLDQVTLNRYMYDTQENLEELFSLAFGGNTPNASVSETPDTLALRDEHGTSQFTAPRVGTNPLRLDDASEEAVPKSLALRDSNGTTKFSNPIDPENPLRLDDITTSLTSTDDDKVLAASTARIIMPSGVIVMWSGSINSIPDGWLLCDGSNGTPNLRDRFVVGAGGIYSVGNSGGANAVSLSVNQIPSHTHTGSTSTAGSHTHTGSTNTAGAHRHQYTTGSGSGWAGHAREGTNASRDNNTSSEGAHSHSISLNDSGAHTHTLTIGETGGGASHENRPPYFALAYIMKA